MITDYISWPRLPLYIGAAIFAFWLYSTIVAERKIRRFGGHAPVRKTWAPFGSCSTYPTSLETRRS